MEEVASQLVLPLGVSRDQNVLPRGGVRDCGTSWGLQKWFYVHPTYRGCVHNYPKTD